MVSEQLPVRSGAEPPSHSLIEYTRLLAIVPIEYKLNLINMNRTELIDKYIKRIKIDYPEDDKLMIDLEDFAKELSINSMSEGERQPVGNNEQGVNKCDECGLPVGNDVFTVCDDCWPNHGAR